MTIRTLTVLDTPFLVSARETFADAWNENMINSSFKAGNLFGFIAEESVNGKLLPIGFITYSVNIDTADIADLFVAEKFRKKGVGNALISAIIRDAETRGVKKLFLEVRESNLPAKKLYEKAGFTFLSVRKKYYADGENALNYIKEL